MKLRNGVHVLAYIAVIAASAAGFSCSAAAQDLRKDLRSLLRRLPLRVTNKCSRKKIQADLAKWKPKIDTIGNVIVTRSGAARRIRVIVTPMDEPGYIVSNITPDGYLRVQRLPQTAPNPVFDSLYSAEPIYIRTRSGKKVRGVVCRTFRTFAGRAAGSR